MFFRNLTVFRFLPSLLPEYLEDALRACQLEPVGPAALSSRGWVSPFGLDERGQPNLCLEHTVMGHSWITLGGENRILPTAVVRKEFDRRMAEMSAQTGRTKFGSRARKRLMEDIVAELLPRSFVKPYRLNASIDREQGLLYVDTSSRKQAEALVSELRHALRSFPALPLNAEVSVHAVLTGWLMGEPLPDGLTLGDEAILEDPVAGGGKIKITHHELHVDEVQKHIEAGKHCTRVALSYKDRVSFMLDVDLVLRKVKFLDGCLEFLSDDADSVAAELDARYTLMSGELSTVFRTLEPALKLTDPFDGDLV